MTCQYMRCSYTTHPKYVLNDVCMLSLSTTVWWYSSSFVNLVNNLWKITKFGTKEFGGIAGRGICQHDWAVWCGILLYLVAERVVVTTKHNDSGNLMPEALSLSERMSRGSPLVKGQKSPSSLRKTKRKLKELVKKHSEFISYPIYLWTEKNVEKKISDDEGEDGEGVEKKEDEGKVEEDKEGKAKKKVKEVRHEWELINNQKPIWLRKPEKVSNEEYCSFYKSLTNDWENPLAWKHFSVEGQLETFYLFQNKLHLIFSTRGRR
ncbi:hypothetical protein DVH24_019947 [Malus domestica]|uniref:Uncharacterized protein n=1 Tax=Malus domestica TaxID=3750 RepID=A0A498I282_MALDO|nr:hypothetical protein DVH24_019947 [Malus domestica]